MVRAEGPFNGSEKRQQLRIATKFKSPPTIALEEYYEVATLFPFLLLFYESRCIAGA